MTKIQSTFGAFALIFAIVGPACDEGFARRPVSPAQSIRFGGPGFQSPSALAVDGTDVVVVGTFEGSVSHRTVQMTGRRGLDGFVLAMSRDGVPSYARVFAGEGDDAVIDVAAVPGGGVVVGGQSSPGASGFPIGAMTPDGAAFVAKLGRDGEPTWTSAAGGSGFQAVTSVALGADGAIYAVGDYSGQLSWGVVSDVPPDEGGAFLVRLTAGGEVDWLRAISGEGLHHLRGLVPLADGSVVVVGTFTESIAAPVGMLARNPDLDETPFVARYGKDGALGWARADLVPRHLPSGHTGAGHDSHAHEMRTVEHVAVQKRPGDGVLVAVTSSAGLSHESFNTAAAGSLLAASLGAAGDVEARSQLTSPTALIQLGAPFVSRGATSVFASWTGEISLPDGPLTSDGRRSLLFLELGSSTGPRAVRWFGLEGASVSARDIAATDTEWLVLGEAKDASDTDGDVVLAVFPP